MRLPDLVRAALVAACIGAFSYGQQEAQAPLKPLSACFPADTVAYIEIPNVPLFIEGARKTGLYALWQDDSMQAIRLFVENNQADGGGAWEKFRMVIEAAEAIKGGAALAIVPASDSMEYLLVARLGEDDSAVRALLDDVYSEEAAAGAEPTRTEINGAQVRISGVDGRYSAIADGLLFIGGRYAVTGALDRRNAAHDAGSFASSLEYTRAAKLFSPGPCAYRAVLNYSWLLEKSISLSSAAPFDFYVTVDKMVADDVETVAMEGAFRLGGVLDHIYISTKSADSRLLDLVGSKEIDESRLSLVPRDALFFGAQVADFAESYRSSQEMLGFMKITMKIDLYDVETHLKQSAGVSIENDIIPALGCTSIDYFRIPSFPKFQGLMTVGGFQSVTLFEVKDRPALDAALARIINYAKADSEFLRPLAPMSPGALSVETTTLGGLNIYSLVVQGTQIIAPSLAVTDEYLVYANNKDAVVTAVDRLIAPSASVVDSSDYTRARGALSSEICQVGYINLDAIIDVVYENLLPQVSQQIDAAHLDGKIPFGSADIPSAFRVKKNVDGIAMAISTAGNLIDIEVYSPIGLVPVVTSALMGAASADPAGVLAGLPPGVEPGVETSPARQRLLEIGAMLQLSTTERHGRFPDALADAIPLAKLQAPQDPEPTSPVDYEYIKGLTAYAPGKTIIVYERKGLQGDGRHVLYVDGSVDFLTESEFSEAMGLPAEPAANDTDAGAGD